MFLYQLSWFKRRQLSFSKNWMFQSVRCLALTLEEKKQTNIKILSEELNSVKPDMATVH